MHEKTLDPPNWEPARKLGYEMVDDVIRYLSELGEKPVWKPVPETVKTALNAGLPMDAEDAADVYREFMEYIFPYPKGNAHPRFWGWVEGSGDIYGALSDFMTRGMNMFGGFGDHSATYAEFQVLNWLKTVIGYPESVSGILVSGSTMANIIGLQVARHAKCPFNDRKNGMQQGSRKLTIYFSSETHSSNTRAVEMLGLGTDNIRIIPVRDDYTFNTEKLKQAISEDRRAGYFPFCVVGTVGTVNTGAIDPINKLAEICRAEDLWLHVDGAFGAALALLPEMKEALQGIEQAESVAFDFHKWLHTPYEAGCVLIKDADLHHGTYSNDVNYIHRHERGVSAELSLFSCGPEMSRSARAVKIWFPFKVHGLNKYAGLIRQNLDQAQYLGGLVSAQDKLELMAPVTMNIVCFRYKNDSLCKDELNELNKNIVMDIQEQGIAVPTYTLLDGAYAIRVAITNHRSKREDFQALVREAVQIGDEMSRSLYS